MNFSYMGRVSFSYTRPTKSWAKTLHFCGTGFGQPVGDRFSILGTPNRAISLGEMSGEESLMDFSFLLYRKTGGFYATQPILIVPAMHFDVFMIRHGIEQP